MRRPLIPALFCSGVQVLATAAAAGVTTPPQPSVRKVPAAWMGFGLMFILFAVVVTISLMPSKRSHQD